MYTNIFINFPENILDVNNIYKHRVADTMIHIFEQMQYDINIYKHRGIDTLESQQREYANYRRNMIVSFTKKKNIYDSF